MLCQMCQKNLSTVRYAEVVNGQVTDVHLCAECLAKHKQNETSGFGLASGAVPTPVNIAVPVETAIPHQSCSTCGAELTDVLQKGKVGCTVCYDVFGEQLEKALRGIHVALIHRGKVPKHTDARERVRADLQTQRALLRSSLKLENYEEAAALRDKIKELEEVLGVSEQGHN